MKLSRRKLLRYLLFLVFVLLKLSISANSAYRDSLPSRNGISAGLSFSTMGLGVSATRSISNRFDIRFNGSFAGYTYDIRKVSTDLQGDANFRFGIAGFFTDFYPSRFFYLSGGMVYNFTKVSMVGQSSQAIEIGDIVMEPDEVGNLGVEITPGWKLNPYLGLGINSRNHRPINVGMEFGVFFQNSPDVNLTASGMLSPTANSDQEQLMEKNISPLLYYPYFSLRISYFIKFRVR